MKLRFKISKWNAVLALLGIGISILCVANSGLSNKYLFVLPLVVVVGSFFYVEITKSWVNILSVFGGNTAVSEWEFLTGSTMAFMPQGSVAYQQFVTEKTQSLVALLKNKGYYNIAMHPYLASGWNKNKVFEYLGFSTAS